MRTLIFPLGKMDIPFISPLQVMAVELFVFSSMTRKYSTIRVKGERSDSIKYGGI
jgi:hypothetical protein